MSYRILEQIMSDGSLECLAQTSLDALVSEIRVIRNKMVVLPTARESEALPELVLLREFSRFVLSEKAVTVRAHWQANEKLEKLFFEDLFEPIAIDVIKARIYTNKEIIRTVDVLFSNLVAFATTQLPRQKPYFNSLINTIVDKSMEYYKTNGKEAVIHSCPFGEPLEPDSEIKKWVDDLRPGTLVDCLKTYAGKKHWSRAFIDNRDNMYLKVRFVGDIQEQYIHHRYYEISPLGSRETDFAWREELKAGDLIDYYSFKYDWALYRITKVVEDRNQYGELVKSFEIQKEVKEITAKKTNENQVSASNETGPVQKPGSLAHVLENHPNTWQYSNPSSTLLDESDNHSKTSNGYDSYPSPTITVRAHAAVVAQPGKYSLRASSQIDDTDDAYFLATQKKQKYAILRLNTVTGASSIYIVKYINIFGEYGGFDFILSVLSGKVSVTQDTMGQLIQMIHNASENLVEPFIKNNGAVILESISQYVIDNAEKNIRNLSQQNLLTILESTHSLAQRVYPSSQARYHSQMLIVRIGICCLKSDILEKQFFGAKQLLSIEAKTRDLCSEISRSFLADILEKENIYEKIIKGHPSLISKSAGVLRILITENKISDQQFSTLWDQVCKTDFDSRSALLGMIKDVQSDLSKDQIKFLVRKMLASPEEITGETFELLCGLRKIGWNKHSDGEIVSLVNDVFWLMLLSEKTAKKDLIKEVTQNFVKSLDQESAPKYIHQIIENYLRNKNKTRSLKLLKTIMKKADYLYSFVKEAIIQHRIIDHCINEIVGIFKSKPKDKTLNADSGPQTNNYTRGHDDSQALAEIQPAEELTLDEQNEIELRLKLLKNIIDFDLSHTPVFTFAHFEQIWTAVFNTANTEESIHKWIKDYLISDRTNIFTKELKELFLKNYRKLLHPRMHNFFKLFAIIFKKVNIGNEGFSRRRVKYEASCSFHSSTNFRNVSLLTKPTDQLFGMKEIWELFEDAQNHKLFTDLAAYLIKIYLPPEFFESENSDLYAGERRKLVDHALSLFASDDLLKGIKASLILTRIVKSEERVDSKALASMATLKEGEKIVLIVEKNTKYIRDRTKIHVFENQTIEELKQLISKEYRWPIASISLVKPGGDVISSTDNILTVESAGIHNQDQLLVNEVEIPEIKEASLLNETGTDFAEKTYKVFHEIFADYSENGRMSKEGLANFTKNATDGSHCSVNDERVIGVFEKYDSAKRGYITEDDFIDFYRGAAVASEARQRTVRSNLTSLGYDRNLRLKHVNNNSHERIQEKLRYELCQNAEFNQQLWKFIGEHDEKGKHARPDPKFKDTLYLLLELLPPGVNLIRQIIENPVSMLANEKHPQLWKYQCILLNTLIFKFEESARLLSGLGIQYGQEEHLSLLAKVLDSRLIEQIFESIRWIQRSFSLNLASSENISPALRTMEKIFKTFLSKNDPEIIADFKNFETYFMRQRRKATEKVQTESPAKPEFNDDFFKNDKTEKEKEDKVSQEAEQIAYTQQLIDGNQLASQVLEMLNYTAVNSVLVDMLKSLNDYRFDLTKAQKNVLKSTMITLISSLRLHDHELHTLLKTDQFQRLIFSGLAHEKGGIRLHYKNLYAFLTSSSHDVQIKTDFLKILLKNISSQSNEELHTLIELASNILGEIGELKSNNKSMTDRLYKEFNFSELFSHFSEKLLTHNSAEVAYDEKEDPLLIAYLSFLEKVIKADESVLIDMKDELKKRLVKFLFRGCLFDFDTKGFIFNTIKCKSKKARTVTINLLVQLLKKDTRNMIYLIIEGLFPLSQRLPNLVPQTFGIGSDMDRKSSLGFLGIKNLGCVCYMIAMLQQFYCTPAFRHGILMAKDNKQVELSEVKGKLIDDNLFHQIQKMFAYLDNSERRDFNPTDFCLSYKDYTGQPVNVMVQQDADEFLKVIFDRLEEAVKRSPYIGVLNSVYTGKICNVILCKGCGYEKVNEEPFNNLSLEVKGLSNLKESFEKFIEEEIISEYMCDKCKNKCDISKKALLKSLPNVLIVYLKKMVFDLDLLMNIKIHSKYEFPMNINLKNYMHFGKSAASAEENGGDKNGENEEEKIVEMLPNEENTEQAASDPNAPATKKPNDDEEYEYKLVGVVIHKGNAEYGHYTSLANVNRNDPKREQITKDLWLEFDDSRVSKFDMSHFEDECFGNAEDKDFPSAFLSPETSISKSAYILVYDKVKKLPIVFPFTEETMPEKEKILNNLIDSSAVEVGPDFLKTSFYNLKPSVPEQYANDINTDNSSLVLEQQLLSANFTNNIAELYNNIDLSISFNPANPQDDSLANKKSYAEAVLNTLPNFLFKVYCVSNDNIQIGKIVSTIESALNFLTFVKFIGNNKSLIAATESKILNFYVDNVYLNLKMFLNAMTNSSDNFIKTSLADFVVCALSALIKNFHIQTIEMDPNAELDNSWPAATIAEWYLAKTLSIFLGFVPTSQINPTHFRRLDSVNYVLYRLADQNLSIKEHFLNANLLITIFDVYLNMDSSKMTQIERTFAPMLALFHVLVQHLQAKIRSNPDNIQQLQEYHDFFERADFFAKMFKEDYQMNNYEPVRSIVGTMAIHKQALSDQIAYVCLKGIISSSDLDAVSYIEGLRSLLGIKDELMTHRLHNIFGVPKLSETVVVSNSNRKSYLYGLAKESTIKKAAVQYTTPFFGEKGLLEILFATKDTSESSSMLLIYYIIEFAEAFPHVLEYLVSVAPPNYLTATFYDWFKSYSEHHLKFLSSTYSSYKPEVTLIYFNTLPQKIDSFERKVNQYLAERKITLKNNQRLFGLHGGAYSSYVNHTQIQINPITDHFELFSLAKNYIIGRTNAVTHLATHIIDEDSFGVFALKVHLINVALMESRPTGQTNLAIPQQFFNYDYYVNKSSIVEPNYAKFFMTDKAGNFEDEEMKETIELAPIMLEGDNDIEESRKQANPQPTEAEEEEEASTEFKDCEIYINRDYIMRVSMTNKTQFHYLAKVKIFSDGTPNFNEEEFLVSMRSHRSKATVQNVTLKNIDGNFDGFSVAISHKKTENFNPKHFKDEDFSDYVVAFEYDD